jgi:hypothetical protein
VVEHRVLVDVEDLRIRLAGKFESGSGQRRSPSRRTSYKVSLSGSSVVIATSA